MMCTYQAPAAKHAKAPKSLIQAELLDLKDLKSQTSQGLTRIVGGSWADRGRGRGLLKG